jgi:hypothetical protein
MDILSLKPTIIVGITIAIGTALTPTLASADAGVYQYTSKGYSVTVSSDMKKYRGCDTKKRCIELTNGEQLNETEHQWKTKNNYIYNMSQISNGRGKYMLKVYSPDRKLMLKRVMNPLGGGNVMSPERTDRFFN